MAKKKKKKQKAEAHDINQNLYQPWISMRSGIRIVAITSVIMVVLTSWQVVPVRGWVQGILWGLFFGAMIWAIFFGNLFINRLLRKKR